MRIERRPYTEKYGAARLGWKLALAVWRSNYGKPTHQVVTLSAEDLRAMKTHLSTQGGGEFLSTNDVIVRPRTPLNPVMRIPNVPCSLGAGMVHSMACIAPAAPRTTPRTQSVSEHLSELRDCLC